MSSKHKFDDVEKLLLEAHRKGVEQAIDLSARTGVPLVIEENGKIKRIKPKYKYIRVPIAPKVTKLSSPK
jgi:hypothetical protein